MTSTRIHETRKSAEALFASGLCCAESVLLAIARAEGVDSDLLPKIATGLCSGMARTGGTCGALSGAILGVGLALGRASAEDPVDPAYTAAQMVAQAFENEFGSRECQDLLGGCDLSTREGQTTFIDQGLIQRCLAYTGGAAEIAARALADGNE